MIRFIVICMCYVVVGAALPGTVSAQSTPVQTEGSAPQQSAIVAARNARGSGDFEQALATLEAALHANPDNGLILYERILTLEAMGEPELALQVVEAKRDVIIRHPDVNDLAVVEQRLISATERAAQTSSAETDAEQSSKKTGDSNSDSVTADPAEIGVTTEPAPKQRSSTPAYIAIGAGAATATTGTILLLLAHSDSQSLACAGLSPDPGCSAGELDPVLSRQEYNDQSDSIATRRLIGGVAVGLGAAAIGWGIYDLLTGEGDNSAVSKLRFTPSKNGFVIGLFGDFQ